MHAPELQGVFFLEAKMRGCNTGAKGWSDDPRFQLLTGNAPMMGLIGWRIILNYLN